MKHAENIFNKLMRKHESESSEKYCVNNETISMQINSYAYINIKIFLILFVEKQRPKLAYKRKREKRRECAR